MGVMTNTQFPTASGVALTIGRNVRAVLSSRGRDLDWLAEQIDVTTHTILRHFTEGMPAWLTLDIANVLDVPAGDLIDGAAS